MTNFDKSVVKAGNTDWQRCVLPWAKWLYWSRQPDWGTVSGTCFSMSRRVLPWLVKLVGLQHQKAPLPDPSFQITHPENRPYWPVWQSSQGRGQSSWWFWSVRCTCGIFCSLQGCYNVARAVPDKGVLATSGKTQAWACHAGRQHCCIASWASALPLLPLLRASDFRALSLIRSFSGVLNTACACTTPQAFPPI